MTRGVGDMVLSSYDMSNTHLVIVHNDGKMKEWRVQIFSEDKVAHIVGLSGNFAAYKVVENDFFVWIFKPYRLAVQIRFVLVQKFLQIFFINFRPFALTVELIPLQTEPFQAASYVIFVLLLGTGFIRVFHPQNKLAIMFSGV